MLAGCHTRSARPEGGRGLGIGVWDVTMENRATAQGDGTHRRGRPYQFPSPSPQPLLLTTV